MIPLHGHQTGDLLDPGEHLGEKRCRLLERSWAVVSRNHLLEHLPVGELVAHRIRQISPMIWRRILVHSGSSIAQLHDIIQIAFGWSDTHLHRFRIHGRHEEIVVEHIAAIAEQHPEEVIQVWHQDEARFGQQGTLTRVWARRGSRPRRRRQNGRESLYVLTATCAASGAAFGLIMPELNTAVVNQFLEEFSRQLAPGVHAVLLWDNAPYHVSGDLVVPANVSLIGLLPYSPELNPVENLWHYLRAHHWSNRVYADYDALLEAATEAWRQVCLDPEKVRSICAAPYLAERR